MKNKSPIRFLFIMIILAVALTSLPSCIKERAADRTGSAPNAGNTAGDIAGYRRYTREMLPDSLVGTITAIRESAIETGDYETWGMSALILANRSAKTEDYSGGIAEMENYIEHVESSAAGRGVLYRAYYRTAEFYYMNGMQNIALDYFLAAADHAATEEEKYRIYYAIGISSENTHITSAGIDPGRYFMMAEDMAKKSNDSTVVANALFGRAGTYFDFLGAHKIKDEPLGPDKLDSLNTAVALLREAERWSSRMDVLDYALGLSYAALKDFQMAQYYIDKVDGYENSAMGSDVMASILICMGHYKEAAAVAQRAYDIGEKASNEADMRNSLHILYYAYKYSGEEAKALDAFEKFSEKWEKMMDESLERQVNVARVRFDTKLKEEQLHAAEKENTLYRQGLLIIGCAFLIVATLLAVIIFYYRKIRKAHRALAQKSLQWAQEPAVKSPLNNGRSDAERRAVVKKLDTLMSCEKHYLRPDLTINDVAGVLEINRTYLSDAINRIYGGSFIMYINDLRIRDAVKLISNPGSDQYTVDAWAKMTGFSNRKTFHNAFVKITGLTPSEFRRNRDAAKIEEDMSDS